MKNKLQNNIYTNFNLRGTFIIFLALIIGTLGGLFAVLFRLMIGWANKGFYNVGFNLFSFMPDDLWKIFVPAIAGIVVGPRVFDS